MEWTFANNIQSPQLSIQWKTSSRLYMVYYKEVFSITMKYSIGVLEMSIPKEYSTRHFRLSKWG